MKYKFLVFVLFLPLACCVHSKRTENGSAADIFNTDNALVQPPGEWKFINDLKAPMWTKHPWKNRPATNNEADLSHGVSIRKSFPDTGNRLETAYADLDDFMEAGDISLSGKYIIETLFASELSGEAFRLDIKSDTCRIMAGDPEGIRRGIFQVEDEMLGLRSALLPIGKIERVPFVKRRISRCVYGPIKRPPAMRDELLDTVNYYPDQYLNRLAHDGVNGLWITVDFRDLVSTRYTPQGGKDGARRLKKLRETVARCKRYGIRTYIFTIEPRAWGNQPPYYNDIDVLEKYPEMGGARNGNIVWFCPSSKTSQDYLYEVVNKIFKEVPGLGGMINITYNERETTCINEIDESEPFHYQAKCPRCKNKEPWEIIYQSLTAMEKGMHDAAPDAELISWLYMGVGNYAEWVYDIAEHTPKGVILQLQFETGVTRTEFGKKLVGGDYWLSTPGPSEAFVRQAEIAREHNTPVSAKLQTGNSHEVASIPFVPVPSMVYRKLEAMHRLGVSHAMLGWYFGNYPGPMIKSSGLLSFNPFPDEDAFLKKLASVYWKADDVPNVVKAWKKFAEGYGNYPLQNKLGYYGPMHDGPVWPLLLKPADAPLSPTWQISSPTTLKPWPPSGDRIGECLSAGGVRLNQNQENVLSLEETVELCRKMSKAWDEGVAIMNSLEPEYRGEPERISDIGLDRALGIQFRSGYNILHFYQLREKMLRMEGRERLGILDTLESIIRDELKSDAELIELCEKDSRLGFHSEAEGYKYFPEKIRWRMDQLKNVLEKDVPEIRNLIRHDQLLFPEYTGKKITGAAANALKIRGIPDSDSDLIKKLRWNTFENGAQSSAKWAASYSKDTLYIIVADSSNSKKELSEITFRIEPRRLWPSARLIFNSADANRESSFLRSFERSGFTWYIAQVPFSTFWWNDEPMHPLRVDVLIRKNGESSSWRPHNPLTSRLVYGTDNPADLGWLVFDN
jgi:hypothetical protein